MKEVFERHLMAIERDFNRLIDDEWGHDRRNGVAEKVPGKVPSKMPSEDIAFLQDDGIDFDTLAAAERRAAAMSVPVSKVLMDFGILSQEKYFRRVSVELGLEFDGQTPVDPHSFFDLPKPLELERMARMVTVGPKNRLVGADVIESIVHVAPDGRQFSALKKLLAQSPHLRRRLRITTPTSNMASLVMRSQKALTNYAVEGLFSTYPQFSAKTVFSARQAVVLVIVLEALLVAWFVSSSSLLISLHALASTFYLGCIALRLYSCLALVSKQNNPVSRIVIPAQDDRLLPTYSILVALYEETDQVEDLVQALSHLDWPRERLEIKLICEEDDIATLQACRRATDRFGGSIFSVIAVPKCHPRTKPKALNYALPLCLGEFVVVYDAEDRPHPIQLREAHSAFGAGSPRLACIQAPLCIHNHQDGWLVRLFAIEYSALFAGMFPAIAKMNLPMPLGGTSNHFKRQVLQAIGGWDPYNVTEDADLGIRLARAGCLVDTIASPTYEEAPVSFSVWLKQRSRWYKGWYQTWLVHMRHPVQLTRDLGLVGSIIFQLLILGGAVSVLVHPALLYHIVACLINPALHQTTVLHQFLFWLDITMILMGYFALVFLAWCTLPTSNQQSLRPALWAVPLYWMLLSVAAWRALWLLLRRPHEWEKTPHVWKRSSPAG